MIEAKAAATRLPLHPGNAALPVRRLLMEQVEQELLQFVVHDERRDDEPGRRALAVVANLQHRPASLTALDVEQAAEDVESLGG